MKKTLMALTASFMFIGTSFITYAQDESSSEVTGSSTSAESQDESSEESSESNETARERATASVRTNDTFGEDLEEGHDYKGLKSNTFPILTIANIRYNDEYLYVDIQIDIYDYFMDQTYDNIINGDQLLAVYQAETNNKRSELIRLRPRYNNLPPELEGDLPIPGLRDVMEAGETDLAFTIPYQLELSLDEAARIIFEFGDEEVEIELEVDSPVI